MLNGSIVLQDIIDEKEAQEGLQLPQTHDGVEENEHIEDPEYIDNNKQQQIEEQLEENNNEQQQIGKQLEENNQHLLVGGELAENNQHVLVGGELENNNQLAENNHQQLNGQNNLQQQLLDAVLEDNELEDHEDFSEFPFDIDYLNDKPWGEFTA